MSFASVTEKYNEQLEAAHAHIEDGRYNLVECGAAIAIAIAGPHTHWTSQISYKAVASLLLKLSVCAVLMSFARVSWRSIMSH